MPVNSPTELLTDRETVFYQYGPGVGIAWLPRHQPAFQKDCMTSFPVCETLQVLQRIVIQDDEIGELPLFDGADLRDVGAIERMIRTGLARFGTIDIVVNNAVVRHFKPIQTFTVQEWNTSLAVNLSAAFHCVRLTLPRMLERRWGRIVSIISDAGRVGSTGETAYAAAKEGIAGLTRSVAREQARFGIRCNMIRPRATVNTGGGEWGQQVFAKWMPMVKALGPHWIGNRGQVGFARPALPPQGMGSSPGTQVRPEISARSGELSGESRR